MRTFLLAALATSCFALPLNTISADELVKKPAVREIILKELPRKPGGQIQKPAAISKISDLADCIGYCLKERLPYQLAENVDFKSEQILYVSWIGSEQDELSYKVDVCPKHREKVDGVTFLYVRGVKNAQHSHFRLIVVPKNTSWKVMEQK